MASLWQHCKDGSLVEVRAALERGEGVDTRGDAFLSTGLMEAAEEGHHEVVSLLLERGAAVNAVDAFHRTALHYTRFFGRALVVRILLAQPGVDCNPRDGEGRTPVMWAVIHGEVECVRALAADHRVELDTTTDEGMTLEKEARWGRRDIIGREEERLWAY
jgi:ankyrin repeat protein